MLISSSSVPHLGLITKPEPASFFDEDYDIFLKLQYVELRFLSLKSQFHPFKMHLGLLSQLFIHPSSITAYPTVCRVTGGWSTSQMSLGERWDMPWTHIDKSLHLSLDWGREPKGQTYKRVKTQQPWKKLHLTDIHVMFSHIWFPSFLIL